MINIESIVMRLLRLSTKWEDIAISEQGEWYNDSAAYEQCAYELNELAKTLMPEFECCWCRDHGRLEKSEYTYKFEELGGWCVDTNLPICKECKWSAGDVK